MTYPGMARTTRAWAFAHWIWRRSARDCRRYGRARRRPGYPWNTASVCSSICDSARSCPPARTLVQYDPSNWLADTQGVTMDLLDRLLGHDRWTTAQLLERCRELRVEQWTQPFDLGHQTLAATFQHIIGNVRVW